MIFAKPLKHGWKTSETTQNEFVVKMGGKISTRGYADGLN